MDRLEPVIDSLSSNWILYFHCQAVYDTPAYAHVHSMKGCGETLRFQWLLKILHTADVSGDRK